MIMAFLLFKINHSAQSRQNNLQFCLTRFFVMAYRLPAPHKAGAGFDSLIVRAGSRYISVMRFFVPVIPPYPVLWRGVMGEPLRSLVSLTPVCQPCYVPPPCLTACWRDSVNQLEEPPKWLYQHALILSGALCSATVKISAFIPLPLPVSAKRAPCFRHLVWSLLPVSVSGRRAMFKLLITLINYQNGDVRQMIHAREYPTYDDAWRDACRMAYSRNDKQGRLTHKCAVKIMEG